MADTTTRVGKVLPQTTVEKYNNNNWIGSGEINQLRGNANRADTS